MARRSYAMLSRTSHAQGDHGRQAAVAVGGGELFGELARAGLVDGIEVAVIPVVLGAGIPLMSPKGPRLSLELRRHRLYAGTGTMFLEYDVRRT